MKLITDLQEISRISELQRKENFDFRAKIKWESESPEALDTLVNKVQRDVSSRIDCKKCANCCKIFDILLTDRDIKRLATAMSMGVEEFQAQFVKKNNKDRNLYFKTKPCPLLREGACTQYEFRPDVCREYPHLDKPGFLGRTLNVIENSSTCPIVFNVWEQLKDKQ